MKESILITGINGFLAGKVCEALADKHFHIAGLRRLVSANKEVSPGIDYYNSIADVLNNVKNINYVFHLAAFIPYGRFSQPDIELYDSNIKFTEELATAFPLAKILFASSVSVYGNILHNPIKVDSLFNQPNLYALSKIAGEAIITNHPNHAIVRFSSIIGPRMKPVSMLPKMINEAKETGIIKIWGNGQRRQNYIDVRDCARLCIACASHRENIITLGVGDRSYTNQEVAEIIASFTGAKIEYGGEDTSPSYVYDASATYQKLKFKTNFSLEQTISDMVNE